MSVLEPYTSVFKSDEERGSYYKSLKRTSVEFEVKFTISGLGLNAGKDPLILARDRAQSILRKKYHVDIDGREEHQKEIRTKIHYRQIGVSSEGVMFHFDYKVYVYFL